MALKAAAILGKQVAKKAVKSGAGKVKKKAKMKVSKVSDMVNEKVQDKLGAEDGKVKKRRGRPKKFQTLAEVEADINLREYQKLKKKFDKLKASKKAKITPAKISPTFYPLDAGLKLEEESKVQTEKITKIISIQKLHKENHQKEKSEIAEINNVLTGIADFIKADYESRVDAVDKQNDQITKSNYFII